MLSVLLDATIESVQTMYRFFVSLGEIRFLLGVALVTFLWFLVRQSSRNRETLRTYKRELNGNDEKYSVKRCLEDGPEKMRHYYYLINKEDKKYHRIVNPHTLSRLGYPVPPRQDDYCFSRQDYSLAAEISILDATSLISSVKYLLKLVEE